MNERTSVSGRAIKVFVRLEHFAELWNELKVLPELAIMDQKLLSMA